jgi:hypothetical protein
MSDVEVTARDSEHVLMLGPLVMHTDLVSPQHDQAGLMQFCRRPNESTTVITAVILRDQLASRGFVLFKQLLTLFAAIACRQDRDE